MRRAQTRDDRMSILVDTNRVAAVERHSHGVSGTDALTPMEANSMTKSVKPASWLSWLKQIAVAAGAVGTIIVTTQHIRPVYAGRAPIVRDLLDARGWSDSSLARAPWATGSGDVALMSP